MNLDLVLRIDAPVEATSESSAAEKTHYEQWVHSNRICLMIMKYTIDKSIRQNIADTDSAKEYLDAVGKKFTKFDNAEKVSGVREHIMKLTYFFNKLKGIKVELANNFLVWQVLESLPSQFNALKITYNAQKDEWSLSKMTTIVTQEEEMMKKAKSLATFMVTVDKGKKKKFFKSNSGNFRKMKKSRKPPQQASMSVPNGPKNEVFKGKCKFCHFFGHMRVDCRKFKVWLDKKCTRLLLVCFESNLVDATIHTTNSLQELRNRRRLVDTNFVTTPRRISRDHTSTQLLEDHDSHMASLLACLGLDYDTQRATMEATACAQTMCVGLRVPLSMYLRACMSAPAPLNEASGVPS
ncbi:hypothetical protein I3843_03G147300 [Carya illinoinensis]|nr:hypothetical protein I3843_03G147300 [Carya illinoinensis]